MTMICIIEELSDIQHSLMYIHSLYKWNYVSL